ncbi:MAG: hypothetical protein FWG58_02850, partial [Methanomassiliicoccaceae archaeon]|nr:hypothetical protein [Methanomassiliicoccaceae archaeon]
IPFFDLALSSPRTGTFNYNNSKNYIYTFNADVFYILYINKNGNVTANSHVSFDKKDQPGPVDEDTIA